MLHMTRCAPALLLVASFVAGIGCTSPDPQGRFDSFKTSTEDDRKIPDMGMVEGGQQVDFSGQYFFGLKTPLNTGDPFYFLADVSVDESFAVEISIQPLKTDSMGEDPRSDARTAVGDAISGTGQLAEDGTFEIDFGDVAAPGDSNPVTGSDIVAQIIISGTVLGEDSFCGTARGDVTVPIMASIAGSTFGTVPVEDGADLTTVEPAVACPEGTLPTEDMGMPGDAGDMGGDMGDMPDNSFYRCPDVDFTGRWSFEFKSQVQTERAEIILDVAQNADPKSCYSGEVYAGSDGTTDLGDVTAIVERDGQLVVRIPNFVIPPGANPLLPDGGTSNITALTNGYNDDGACGDFETVIDPIGLTVNGTWSMLRDGAADLTYSADLAMSGCESITRGTPCAFGNAAETYALWFETMTGGVTMVNLDLEAADLTCLQGTVTSMDDPNPVLSRIVSAADDGNGNLMLNGRNFFIPGSSNPLGDDPLWADFPVTTEQIDPGVSMCGTMQLLIVSPPDFPVAMQNGTFAAGTAGNEPTTALCP